CMPTPGLAEGCVEIGLRRALPVIVDVRDIWPETYLSSLPEALKPAARILLRREFARTGWTFRNAAAVTAVSETFLDWALSLADRARTPADAAFPLGYPKPSEMSGAELSLRIGR